MFYFVVHLAYFHLSSFVGERRPRLDILSFTDSFCQDVFNHVSWSHTHIMDLWGSFIHPIAPICVPNYCTTLYIMKVRALSEVILLRGSIHICFLIKVVID